MHEKRLWVLFVLLALLAVVAMIKTVPEVLLELRPSLINNVGVFAVPEVKRGRKVADGIHEEDYQDLIPWSNFENLSPALREKIMAFCVGTQTGFIPPDDLDFNRLSIEWYLNHSCEGNCGFNDEGDFVALRNIKAGEELTYDYGLAESNPKFRLICTCGSAICRKTVTGNDWKDESFQAKHREHMLPRLRLPVLIHA